MNIGIAAPIEVLSLKDHLTDLSESDLQLGLGGSAINTLIDGFIKAGHNVTVFTLDKRIKGKYVLKGPNLKIIFGYYRTLARSKMFNFDRKEYKQIERFIREEKDNIDIVNAHWSYEFAIGTIRSGVPHLITFRDDSLTVFKMSKHPYTMTRLLMDFYVRRKAKCISFNSPMLKDKVGLEGDVIPNSIKDSYIGNKRKYPYSKKMKICFIANANYYLKNPLNAIKAFASIQDNDYINAELHFIGKDYSKDSAIAQQARKESWDKNVIFRGGFSSNELMTELEEYDILLHTSREESFGNTLIEAMAKGIPVIGGKRSGAVPWVLDYGKAGILVDVEDISDIASALIRLLTDPILYESLSISELDSLRKRFSQSHVCQLYIESYQKIIS